MFIFTAKLNRGKVLSVLLLTAVVLSGLLALLLHPNASLENFQTVSSLDSNEARIGYLAQFGWQVRETPVAEETILIPEDVETTCASYCVLQREQGFDLSRYAGKEVQRYTYEVLNYPTGETNIQANLLILDGTVIAGDICTPALDGWMHGLTFS